MRTTKKVSRRERREDKALHEAHRIRSIAESANPDDTGEMRTVLSTLLETEASLTRITQRFLHAS